MFGLLTDETLTAKFPAAERKAIREHVPWTRLVSAAKTIFEDKTIDLPEFITQNRERLALKPNDDTATSTPISVGKWMPPNGTAR